MGALFTLAHVAQLHEIQSARLKRDLPGIGPEVEELIRRLTSGGVGSKSDDFRRKQAKVLWDKGFGRELGAESFDNYLYTIPVVPEALLKSDRRFPTLVLVDVRLGIEKICKLLGIDYKGDDPTFVDFDPKQRRTEKVYWIRLQDGKENLNKSVRACRDEFAKDETGLTIHEGLALFAQNPDHFRQRVYSFTDSVRRGDKRGDTFRLYWFGDRPELTWGSDVFVDPDYGSCSRLK